MKQKLLIPGLVFLALVFITYFFLKQKPAEQGTLSGMDRAFAVKNAADIQKIFLANRIDGSTVLLERQQDHWMLNGRDRARDNAIENLLSAVTKVQMMYKPPEAAVPNMLQDLATRGIKVEVYGKQDKLLKVYYVGGSTSDERGTYMIMEGAEQPYVTHIPSWEGNLRFRYNLKGDAWRDRSIFRFKPKEVATLAVEYPTRREESFKLVPKGGGSLQVQPFYNYQEAKSSKFNPRTVDTYLEQFATIGAEAFRNDYQFQDSIRAMVPFCVFQVELNAGEQQQIRLFPIYPEQNGPITNYSTAPQVERYFVDINGSDFVLAQHRVIQKVLRGYEYFFQAE